MHSGREKKTKKQKPGRSQPVSQDEAELAPPASSKRDQFLKKSSRHKQDEDLAAEVGPSRRRQQFVGGGSNLSSVPESVFVSWDELLNSREVLKRRLDAIAAVHGWEAQHSRKSFLGGIEPDTLLQAVRLEIKALGPAADALGKADILLELRQCKAALEALSEERDRLVDDMVALREDNFEARDMLASQSDELDTLRQHALERDRGEDRAHGVRVRGEGRSPGSALSQPSAAGEGSAPNDLDIFQVALSRGQAAEGKCVIDALKRLKLPEEAAMGSRELACWRENKKTIVNSLKTLSGQIYSARTRILYEIIQVLCPNPHGSDSNPRTLNHGSATQQMRVTLSPTQQMCAHKCTYPSRMRTTARSMMTTLSCVSSTSSAARTLLWPTTTRRAFSQKMCTPCARLASRVRSLEAARSGARA